MAESVRGHLSEPSRAIQSGFLVPPPRQHTAAFMEALRDIIVQNKIDLLIPTYEEVFYVAMGRAQLPCRVFVESIEKLQMLHNKWSFALHTSDLGLSVPETFLVGTADELLLAFAQWRTLVFKPVYSRFASRTLIAPTIKQAMQALMSEPASPWIAQELIDGRQICTYSIAHGGRLTAHTAYRADFTAGQGAAIVFQHLNHPETLDWVQRFVAAVGFTGQIAFDFIESSDGEVFALECNPRATSGVHLLSAEPNFTKAFLDDSVPCLMPSQERSSMLSTDMLVYGLPASLKKRQLAKWLSTFFAGRDVVFDAKDPLPFLLQWRSIFSHLALGRKYGISALAASTYDIEWNGERTF